SRFLAAMARGPVDLSRRCARCLFPFEACLCPDVPRLETRTSFLLLRHASELNRPTNSGRWAALALTRARIVDYAVPAMRRGTSDRPPGGGRVDRLRGGEDDARHHAVPSDLSALSEPGTAVLFPSPHPLTLDAPPQQLVVLDATWAQARRMIQRLPELQRLPRLALPSRRPPSAADPIRRPTVKGGVSTLEAIAGALHLLGEEEAARALDALHAAALERSWRLRRPVGRARCA
ncbi:MAG TPA: tRNA-uridine aminocarboxypropyltransferase, partial [Anaeromyxobacteraceae bacterium]